MEKTGTNNETTLIFPTFLAIEKENTRIFFEEEEVALEYLNIFKA